MLSKCANPGCSARFRYLHEGRIFNLALPAPHGNNGYPGFSIQHYWLCGPCSRVWKVAVDFGVPVLQLLHLELPERKPQDDVTESKAHVA